MKYEDVPSYKESEMELIIQKNDLSLLYLIPLSASLESMDQEWAEKICVRLANHCNQLVKGNAILGFGHVARRFGKLTQSQIQPLIEEALQSNDQYVKSQAESAADDIEYFLKWKIRRPSKH